MGFFGGLFGRKAPTGSNTSPLLACRTDEQRVEWFARTQPWQTMPPWLVRDVVAQMPGNPPTALALFVDTAERASVVAQLQALHRVEPRSVACATISGIFLRVGGPLAQKLLQGKKGKLSASDRQVVLAKDCLTVALGLHADPPSAHFLLAVLLGRTDQFQEAVDVAEDGLSRVEEALSKSEEEDPDDDLDEREELEEEREGLKKLLDVLVPALEARQASKAGEESSATAEVRRTRAATGTEPLVEYSKDTGTRGPDWMENNVDPRLGVFFRAKPDDPAWNQITPTNVAAYQLWFQRAVLRAALHEAHASEQLVGRRAEAVCKVAFQAKEEHGLNPLIVLVLAHQYVEADPMFRGLHTVDWVAFMMSRNDCAPSPESIAKFVIDFYGLQRER